MKEYFALIKKQNALYRRYFRVGAITVFSNLKLRQRERIKAKILSKIIKLQDIINNK